MKRGKVFVLLLFVLAALTASCGCDAITGAAVYEPNPEATNQLSPLPELPASRWADELVEADMVVLGTITALQDTILPDKRMAFTTANFSVEEVIKGDPGIRKITFRAAIDFPSEITLPGQAREWPYAVADRLLISLYREPAGTYTKGQIYWGESPKATIPPFYYSVGNYEYTIDGVVDLMGLIVRVMRDNRIPVAMENPPLFNPARQLIEGTLP